MLAMMVRMVFFAVELAGFLISYEIGFMASNSVNPLLGSTDATLTSLFYYFSLLIFFVAGVHLDVMRGFVLSFEILPIGEFLLRPNPMVEYVREVSECFCSRSFDGSSIYCIEFYC